MNRLALLTLAVLAIPASYAQVHKSLPKGVRLLAYRNVQTSKIDSTYNQSQAVTPISNGLDLNHKTLSDFNEVTSFYFEQLRAISPEAYEKLSLGEFRLDSQAQVMVHGFGGGYGITNRLTVYGILPYYNARVDMKYNQVKESNAREIADQLQGSANGDIDATIASITNSLPGLSDNTLQSVIVNELKYKELGNWQGSGFGDTELGAMYRLIDHGYWGFSITGGVVAPTGRQDDPDLLQDIAFGDGQWDVFSEGALGFIMNDRWMFGTTLRYTYQAPADKELRIPVSRETSISDEKGTFNVKYGDMIDSAWQITYSFNDWFSVTPAYQFNYQMPSKYESSYGAANDYLAYNSDRMAHVARITGSISSIQPFLKKKFLLPATINLNYQQTLAGKNVPKMGRLELELRMMF